MKTGMSFLTFGAIFIFIEIIINTYDIQGPYVQPWLFLGLGVALVILGIVLLRFEN